MKWRTSIMKRLQYFVSVLFTQVTSFGGRLNESNITALSIIFSKKRRWFERLFWAVIVIVSGACLFWLTHTTLETMKDSPVSFTPDTLSLRWSTTFPSVSVCEQYQHHYTTGQLKEHYPDLMNASDFTRKRYLSDLIFVQGSCRDCEACGISIPCDFDWHTMADKVRRKSSELFTNCAYGGQKIECSDYFLPIDTEKGVCYAFNSLQSKMTPARFESNIKSGPGVLSFNVLANADIYVLGVEEVPVDVMRDEQLFDVSTPATVTEYIFAIVEVENEPEIEAVDVQTRECNYFNEKAMSFTTQSYPVYSHSACVISCKTNFRLEHCGCIHFIRDIAYKDRYCNFTGLVCLTNFDGTRVRKIKYIFFRYFINKPIFNLTTVMERQVGIFSSDICSEQCKPSCLESEITRIALLRYPNTDESMKVIVRMSNLPSLRYSRHLLRTPLDFVVSLGGFIGLCYGASLLSLIEIVLLLAEVKMGNTESNVTSGVKKQAGTSTQRLYKLVDLKGGGLLIDMMKRAAQSKQYAEIDHAIKTKVEPFLYNKGKGRYIPISRVVLLRNKERPRHKQLPEIKAMENPDEEFDIEKDWPEVTQEEYDANPSAYREICWDLKERGAVGETILHICLLNVSSLNAELAKRLLRFYPKLINDVYMSDEYYGESVLHMAIVNEDPSMVKYLLDAGANYHERCFGNFMCPEDQKASRSDSQDHEWVNVQPMTNYEGYVYWGEYPLSFAACLGQEECYRLVLARAADPNRQDTNGNTVLHMLVIYQKMSTFDMAYELGASLSIRNVLSLTPLTLAAKLARIELFFHILNIEREIYWQIGSITCAAYPLSQIDTIDVETGNISKDSALNLVVFGEKDEHLELMDGVLIDLLKTKWNSFVKFRFYRQFILFSLYFLVSLVCFTLRPGPPEKKAPGNTTLLNNSSISQALTLGLEFYGNSTKDENINNDIYEIESDAFISVDVNRSNDSINQVFSRFRSSSKKGSDAAKPKNESDGWWDDIAGDCRLMQLDTVQAQIRLSSEVVLWFGALSYIIAALREARFLGTHMFFENLSTAPSRVMFLFSCILMVILPSLRLWCAESVEDHVAVVIMLTTAPYFLFYCRGFKTVGPFVVMIYRMVMGDLLRFVCIYLVFVMGFSQAYYIIFLSFESPKHNPDGSGGDAVTNPMQSPMESIMAMFLMSLTSFGDYYSAFEKTDHEVEAKLLFVIYMIIVAILLVNMLIAMMGNTYQKIAETRNEWQRQWARIVLVVERGAPPTYRLRKLRAYSQPMSDGRRALVLRLNQTEEDKEEMKEILEMKRTHERMLLKRQHKLATEGKPLF